MGPKRPVKTAKPNTEVEGLSGLEAVEGGGWDGEEERVQMEFQSRV